MFQFRQEFIREKNLIAWSFVDPKNPARVVDAIINYKLLDRNIVKITVNGEKIPTLSRLALIAMKKVAGRPQDLEDVRALEEINEEG